VKKIQNHFQSEVPDGILEQHKLVPTLLNAAKRVESLPTNVVASAQKQFLEEFMEMFQPPYAESDATGLTSLPSIPNMPNQASPVLSHANYQSPQLQTFQATSPPQMTNFSNNMQNFQQQSMNLQQQNAQMMNLQQQQMMNFQSQQQPNIDAMIQLLQNRINSVSSGMMNFQNQGQPLGFQNSPNNFHMNMNFQNSPTPTDTASSQFPDYPSFNSPDHRNFPFFTPQSPSQVDYSYVDAPCAALPYRFYSKIFRHIAHSYIDRLVYQKEYHDPKYLWVATEKVKGFSMSLITDGVHISVGTRSEILSMKEHYDKVPQWYEVFRPYFSKIIETFNYCNETLFPGLRSLQIFVELFGGDYPHKDVENRHPYSKPIVREDPVFYSPDYHLYAFDIYINGDFIPFNQTLEIFQSCDWLHAKVLAAGSFEEIMRFDVDKLESFIPGYFGLPEINGNIAEGIVLRMLHHTRRFKKKRDIHGLKSPEPQKVEYFTEAQTKLLDLGREYFNVERLAENLKNQPREHVELWAKTYPSRLVGRLLADGCKRFRNENADEISSSWTKKKVPFGRYFKPHVQKVVEQFVQNFQFRGTESSDGRDSSTSEEAST
jgi:Rnl2 family RNA ligase